MNLKDIRTELIKISGRYDLVIDGIDFADNGANFYINSGIKLLDRLAEIPESRAKLYFPLAVGEYSVTFQHGCRAISEVWINDTNGRTQLGKVQLGELKYIYNEVVSMTGTALPYLYALAELRALETTSRDSLGVFINKTWEESDAKYNYRGIIVAPPSDRTCVVEVSGLFKNAQLSADADENYWTVEENDLLLEASLYKLEVFGQGTEQRRDWLRNIMVGVNEINKDLAYEESIGVTQTEG